MRKIYIFTTLLALASCATDEPKNPKDIPTDTGAQPQRNVIVSAPPGALGHGRF